MNLRSIETLQCTTGNHYKEYTLAIMETAGHQFRLYVRYGRIGGAQNTLLKYTSNTKATVQYKLNELKTEKVKKGYRNVPVTPTMIHKFTKEFASSIDISNTEASDSVQQSDIENILSNIEVQ